MYMCVWVCVFLYLEFSRWKVQKKKKKQKERNIYVSLIAYYLEKAI